MKHFLLSFLILLSFSLKAQETKPPVYPGCEDIVLNELMGCFNNKLKAALMEEFQVPAIAENENYKGTVKIVFVITKEGEFEILYINAMYQELEDEVHRVFKTLPTVQAPTYNGRAIDERYQFPLAIPLSDNNKKVVVIEDKKDIEDVIPDLQNTLFPEFQSELNIPFVHQEYDDIIYNLNKDENTHTASKPYLFNEVKPYIDLEAKRTSLLKNRETWGGRKLHNEHLALVKGKNYWFTLNPVFDLQVGKDNSDVDYTYNNTRGLQIQGSLGEKFSFSTSFYESQGRFAEYVNKDTRRLGAPIGANAIVHGRGKATSFKEGGFDYPVAEAYLSYTPNKFFNFQFGNGKNFIGDGYRSLFLSDVASPYPFLKISTQFWKIKYTNLWMWMDDVRRITNEDNSIYGTNFRKYVAMHHLSWNVTKNFNIGLFEAVITNQDSYNGFDVSFFNPIIFYRAVEFSNGGDLSGNVQVGLNMKYKVKNNISIYSQFLIDELTTKRVFDGTGYWGNKFAFQLGVKYYNAFKIDGLMLQGEFNWVRPYTYSHGDNNPNNPEEFDTGLNAGHFNQAITHLWGANFYEIIGIARYKKDRWFGSAKLIVGKKGFDYDENVDNRSYGGDIWRSYDDRVSDIGNDVGQGNSTNIFIADFQGGYVVNPVNNLQLFGGVTLRNFSPDVDGDVISKDNTTWFTIGFKSSLFNSYYDF
ncbi:gliding motility protein RemB [Lutimonas halocynthiae]|uniref:gliding motility protein RemB n=1 Tax=Lutimonas halocynthiae TaxID=1446477 RepID=UPI0025B5F552|nr:gliding motility protein RemB [Lutimonas halocynthiae]MDN3642586.1 gliding motility protein RemB [Lutimonas halocynthiae]